MVQNSYYRYRRQCLCSKLKQCHMCVPTRVCMCVHVFVNQNGGEMREAILIPISHPLKKKANTVQCKIKEQRYQYLQHREKHIRETHERNISPCFSISLFLYVFREVITSNHKAAYLIKRLYLGNLGETDLSPWTLLLTDFIILTLILTWSQGFTVLFSFH